ncbi:hypothetical protein [Thermodesulfovibrio hydrogeniphilus]
MKRAFLIFIVLLLLAAPCFAQPTVTITPSTGAPTTPIKIEGKGFQPNEEIDIIITLDEGEKVGLGTEKVDVVVTNEKGEFSVNSGIPTNAKPGTYKIDIVGNKGSVTEAKIEVTPKEKK